MRLILNIPIIISSIGFNQSKIVLRSNKNCNRLIIHYKIGRQIVETVVKIHLRKYLQIQTLEIMRLMLVNYIIKKSP